MKDYNVKSEVEIKFVSLIKSSGKDALEAESKVRNTIIEAANYEFGGIVIDGTKVLIDIKCTTIDYHTGIVLHQDK